MEARVEAARVEAETVEEATAAEREVQWRRQASVGLAAWRALRRPCERRGG